MSAQNFMVLLQRICALIEAEGGANTRIRAKERGIPSGAIYAQFGGNIYLVIFQPLYGMEDIDPDDIIGG